MKPVERKIPERAARTLDVLLAEDNAVSRKVIEAVLMRQGHHVTVVTDGRQAVDQAAAKAFDVVLMDMRMPVMDGLAATRAIRLLAAPHGTMPIVALTANDFQTESEACFAAGMDEFLAKPVNLDHMTAALARLCTPQSAPQVPAIPEFDPAQYQAYERAIGADTMAEVRCRFETVQADLAQALSTVDDWDAIAWAAHATAGCARYLGLMALEMSCRQLEAACRNGDKAAVSELARAVKALLDKSTAR